jgi:hypothetical protein
MTCDEQELQCPTQVVLKAKFTKKLHFIHLNLQIEVSSVQIYLTSNGIKINEKQFITTWTVLLFQSTKNLFSLDSCLQSC